MVKLRPLLFLLIALPVALSAQARRGSRVTVARTPDTNVYCSYLVSPTSISAPSTLQTYSLTITAGVGCAWTAVSNNGFLTVTAGASGTGTGTTSISVAANAGVTRSGTLTIAGQTVMVNQASAGGCTGATSATVVPCAFGPALATRAAYGGGSSPTIVRVTNLNDSGAGSLRAALEGTHGPEVVVFETSGMIDVLTDIVITSPYLTLAGQTAPSPGITIRRSPSATAQSFAGILAVHSHDVLLQHVRIRAGDSGPSQLDTQGYNNFEVYDPASGSGVSTVYNVVLDHVSSSWASGKNFIALSLATNGAVSIWRSIFSETLYQAKNVFSSVAGQVSGLNVLFAQKYYAATTDLQGSIIQSVMALSPDRNPELQGSETVNILNNIIYGWGQDHGPSGSYYPYGTFAFYDSSARSGAGDICCVQANISGNRYISNTITAPNGLIAIGTWNEPTGTKMYYSQDNTLAGPQGITTYMAQGSDRTVFTQPFAYPSGYALLASSTLETTVLPAAGARPLDRDSVDTRIATAIVNRTGDVISSQTAVGGWPTLAVNSRAFTAPATPNHVNADGYTDLEHQLQAAASALEP